MSLTAREVTIMIGKWSLRENGKEPEDSGDFEYFNWSTFGWDIQSDDVVLGDYTAELVEQQGGEGEGDIYFIVFKVGEQFFKLDAFYSSYDGVYWDDVSLHEVEPVEVARTEYVAVKR